MRFLSLLDRRRQDDCDRMQSSGPVRYDSVLVVDSKAMPGVRFEVNRVSFSRRMELVRRIREISQKAEFLQAGMQLQDQIEANLLSQEIDAIYLRWALVGIEGLMIDGEAATVEHLIASGPEELTREILKTIKKLCGLDEAERKN